MTAEEAIQIIKFYTGNTYKPEKIQEAINMSIKALERHVPKKDNFRIEISGKPHMPCPNCGKCIELNKNGVVYCDNCGQAILDD